MQLCRSEWRFALTLQVWLQIAPCHHRVHIPPRTFQASIGFCWARDVSVCMCVHMDKCLVHIPPLTFQASIRFCWALGVSVCMCTHMDICLVNSINLPDFLHSCSLMLLGVCTRICFERRIDQSNLIHSSILARCSIFLCACTHTCLTQGTDQLDSAHSCSFAMAPCVSHACM